MAVASAQVLALAVGRLAATATAGARIFTDRRRPITAAELPAWRVLRTDEPAAQEYLSPVVNEHTLTIDCDGLVRAIDEVDDALDVLLIEGQAALFAEPVPHQFQLTNISRGLDTEGETAVGRISITLTAKYLVDQAQPETIL